MLNSTPSWKLLLVIFLVALCGLYALPNVYGEDPSVQISAGRNTTITPAMQDQISNLLAEREIEVKRVEFADEQILVRLKDNNTQLIAQEILDDIYGDDYFVAINLAADTPAWLNGMGASPMKLGLDLRGGVHFLMEVDMKSAVSKAIEDLESDVKLALREERLRYRSVQPTENGLRVQFRDQETLDSAKFFLRNRYGNIEFNDTGERNLTASFSQARLDEIQDYAVKQNITIIRNRVNQLGVAEPLVQRQGAARIVVQLPGIQDTARAKEILNATATLEFRMLDQRNSVQDAVSGRVPVGSQLILDKDGRPQLLEKEVMLTGNHIIDANSGVDEYGIPQVNISLDSKGGGLMSRATKDNIGNPMATVFIEYKTTDERDEDGNLQFEKLEKVISVATIQARLGSNFRITGLDSPKEARDLALLLRAGALIAPIQIVEERTVGPSLGAENIELGMTAIVYGLIAVLVFMAIYYKGFGLVADTALIINLVMIVGVMSMIPGATLTLPGMAGILLTVGMAVDANVLIFERIREELRDGRSVQQAIHHGYDSAFVTILDANITTFIAALILFAVGTGPIKGFAVTLMIGILTSMFTAIILSRVLVNAIWGGRRLKSLTI